MDHLPIINEARPDPKAKEKTVAVVKSSADIQRLKIEKLMKNPEKPAYVPEAKKSWKPKAPPEFVRDVMGSSAGAGSGEFHVYRHIRRREYNRQAYFRKEEKRQKLDEDYMQKHEENKTGAEMATAKRRAKRLRKKKNRKQNQLKNKINSNSNDNDNSGEEDASSNDDNGSNVDDQT